MNSLKKVLTSPAFLHALLIAGHVAVTIFVRNQASLALAGQILTGVDAIEPELEKALNQQ